MSNDNTSMFKKETFVACKCNPKANKCPKVIIEDTAVFITDDFGGKVKMDSEEFALIVNHFHSQINSNE